jgi:hypothetical protein
MPLFSIVVPTYNRLRYLPRTLQSVWDQEFQDFELIVVDDGSTDGTCDWLDRQGAHIKVLRQANLGPGAARNLGVRNASGTYVAFLDSDDIWFPWTLASYTEVVRRFDHPALIASCYVSFDDELGFVQPTRRPVRAELFVDYLASAARDFAVGSGTVAIRTDALRASGGFLEDRLNAEDHDLVMRLGEQRGFVQMIEPVVLGWRRHPHSESSDQTRTVAGVLRLLSRECSGAYPGGDRRFRQRQAILTRHVRAAAMGCLGSLQFGLGWLLYRRTFAWHVALRRWKFLFGFPLLLLRAIVSRRTG